jgi:hypothetical protein
VVHFTKQLMNSSNQHDQQQKTESGSIASTIGLDFK